MFLGQGVCRAGWPVIDKLPSAICAVIAIERAWDAAERLDGIPRGREAQRRAAAS